MLLSTSLQTTKWVLAIAQHEFFIIFTLLAVFVVMGFAGWGIRKLKRQSGISDRLLHLLQVLTPSTDLEQNLDKVIETISGIVEAPYYAAYIKDLRSGRYVLRAIRHPYTEFDDVRPSYSGLSLPKHETYIPPRTIEPPDSSLSVLRLEEDAVSIVELRTWGMSCIFRISHAHKVTKLQLRELRSLVKAFEHSLDALIKLEIEREQVKVIRAADDAVRRVAAIASDVNTAIQVLVAKFSSVVDGVGGVFIPWQGESNNTDSKMGVYGTETARTIAAELQETPSYFGNLVEIIGDKPFRVVRRDESEFYQLPRSFASSDVGAIAVISIPNRGLLLFLYGPRFDAEAFEHDGKLQIKLLSDQLSEVISHHHVQKHLMRTTGRVLWQLVDAIDNMDPHSVGHSAMVTRYALVTGRELGLDEQTLQDLALAAHLANIGVIGVEPEIVTKQGEYSAFERESMQNHPELGASMIHVATGNENAAKFVLYHHERVDGMGFPSGLSGSDIPEGAKILHMIEVFIAKVSNRAWRPALTFEEALGALRSVSGTQLDGRVVEAFISWLNRQQRNQSPRRSLSRCHEMLCVPERICETCPAFKLPNMNCWEVEGNQCRAHGRECTTCFVRTEVEYRKLRA